MKIRCSRKELYEAVQIVETVTSSATTKPILQDIKIATESQNLELSATDLEVGIRYFVKEGIEILQGGSIVVPGMRLSGILREWVEDEIGFSVEGNVCHLQGQDSLFKLFGGDLDQFPLIPNFVEGVKDEEKKSFTIRSEVLSDMIRKTAYAVATERAHQTLNGVLLAVNGNKIRMVATDGRRLARIERDLEAPIVTPRTGIVPVKGLNHLLKVISARSDMVEVLLEETHLLARTERAVVYCRLIEGQYPNVEEVIPVDNDKKVELEGEQLLSAVRRASLLTGNEFRAVRFRFEPGKLIMSSEAADLGESRIELVISYTGEPFSIGFNPDFVMDVLKVVAKGTVTMELKRPDTAGIIRDKEEDLSLIMPINLLQE